MGFNFHEGELTVQRRAGVAEEAAEVRDKGWVGERITASGEAQLSDFDTREVFVTSVDEQGRVWTSPINGANPGFLDYRSGSFRSPDVISVSGGRRGFLSFEGDPLLENIRRADARIGILIMSHRNIKRYRIDGRVARLHPGSNAGAEVGRMDIAVTMAMGNCPKYVHKKELVANHEALRNPVVKTSTELTPHQMRWIAGADGFVLGTFSPAGANGGGGADASNRGGNPGFVTVRDAQNLSFPDYRGNNLYLSLGNIESYGRAALLFIDRDSGDVLQLTTEAQLVWEADGSKRIDCRVLAVSEATAASPLRYRTIQISPFSPPVVPAPLPAAALLTSAAAAPAAARLAAAAGGGGSGHRRLHCVCVTQVASGIKTFRLEAEDGGLLQYTAGQFATFVFSPRALQAGLLEASEGAATDSTEEPEIRNWTITSAPPAVTAVSAVTGKTETGHRWLEISVKFVEGGRVSPVLHRQMQSGSRMILAGVGGDFTIEAQLPAPAAAATDGNVAGSGSSSSSGGSGSTSGSKLLFLSAGIGITPMAANLRWLAQQAGSFPDSVLLHASRTVDEAPFLEEFAALARGSNGRFRSHFALTGSGSLPAAAGSGSGGNDVNDAGNGSGGGGGWFRGRPTAETLRKLVPDAAERLVFLCGPAPFMAGMEQALVALGVPPAAIRTEEFYF